MIWFVFLQKFSLLSVLSILYHIPHTQVDQNLSEIGKNICTNVPSWASLLSPTVYFTNSTEQDITHWILNLGFLILQQVMIKYLQNELPVQTCDTWEVKRKPSEELCLFSVVAIFKGLSR